MCVIADVDNQFKKWSPYTVACVADQSWAALKKHTFFIRLDAAAAQRSKSASISFFSWRIRSNFSRTATQRDVDDDDDGIDKM